MSVPGGPRAAAGTAGRARTAPTSAIAPRLSSAANSMFCFAPGWPAGSGSPNPTNGLVARDALANVRNALSDETDGSTAMA